MVFFINNFKVKISFYFFLVMSLLCFYSDDYIVIASIFFVIIHELGHIFTFFIFKQPVQEIVLLPFGIKIIKNENLTCSYIIEIFIFSMGIIFNAILFAIFFFLYKIYNVQSFAIFSSINLVLLIFNALPISVLDGGNILKIFFVNIFGVSFGENLSKVISTIFSIFIFFTVICLNIHYNISFSLVITSVYLLLSNFSLLHKSNK